MRDIARTFSVFTPFDRDASRLRDVYDCLAAQTHTDFEWLIVGREAAPRSERVVTEMALQAAFPVRYVRAEAVSDWDLFWIAVREARGRLFTRLEEGGAFSPRALERLAETWQAIDQHDRAGFSSVLTPYVEDGARPEGNGLPRDVFDSDAVEVRYRYCARGEHWGCDRTDVLRANADVASVENQHPERVIRRRTAPRFRTRYLNERLTKGGLGRRHRWQGHLDDPMPHMLEHVRTLNDDIGWLRFAPEKFFAAAVHYVRYSMHARVSPREQARRLTRSVGKILWGIALPFGVSAYLRDRRRRVQHEQEGG